MLWKAPGTPAWKTMSFHDQMSEILFCSAMWTKVSADEQLRRDVNMLNHARMQVPGALPGFEDVVRLFLGTSVTMGKKANGKTELVEVVDLSED
ncbi:hypothetical protein HYALB_00012772 [Hymenoscyphus albidus]|uniref:Uncharacterized protein n=1 Tax=Hymenoscyphus albidus TaxID=595503 RepID=A0A9N9LZS6_9HELO|nr:hypothetical protein HYALB_00012772 [Hymenoscyphus albidus]